jgi:hypothetical protein
MMRWIPRFRAAALTTLLVPSLFVLQIVDATNPFSSNVVALTGQNWQDEVVGSPHAVIVNICRAG